MTIEYSDVEDLFNDFNLTGIPSGTSKVPDLNLDLDLDNHYIITYTFLRNYSDITSTIYYDANDIESQSIIDGDEYNYNIETAIENILNPINLYSASFSDIANINFSEASAGTGIIAFAQLNDNFPIFSTTPATGAGTYRYSTALQDSSDRYGDVFINSDNDAANGNGFSSYNIWDESGTINPGTEAYKILFEEISQSLGIDIFDSANIIRNLELDSNKYTVTSYNVNPDMHYSSTIILGPVSSSIIYEPLGNPFSAGLQLFDIAAIQEIYGRNYDTRNANTSYSKITAFSSNLSDGAFVYSIWDGGGTDTIDASGYDVRAQIDLRQGHFSSIGKDGNNAAIILDNLETGYDAGNVSIAYHTVIENAIGTSENDILIGNAWGNKLEGGAGSDELYGDGLVYDDDAGFVSIDADDEYDPNRTIPQSDNDILDGGADVDTAYGGRGNDIFIGHASSTSLDGDFYHGGGFLDLTEIPRYLDGLDTIDYSSLGFGIKVDLEEGWAARWDSVNNITVGNEDTLASIESVIATEYDDIIIGESGYLKVLDGRAGVDKIYSNVGNNTFIGHGSGSSLDGDYYYGGGYDTIDYSSVGFGVKIDLDAQSVQKWNGGSSVSGAVDHIESIDRIIATNYDDLIIGSLSYEFGLIDPGAGADIVNTVQNIDIIAHGDSSGLDGDTYIFNASYGFRGEVYYDHMQYGISVNFRNLANITVQKWENGILSGAIDHISYAGDIYGTAFDDKITGVLSAPGTSVVYEDMAGGSDAYFLTLGTDQGGIALFDSANPGTDTLNISASNLADYEVSLSISVGQERLAFRKVEYNSDTGVKTYSNFLTVNILEHNASGQGMEQINIGNSSITGEELKAWGAKEDEKSYKVSEFSDVVKGIILYGGDGDDQLLGGPGDNKINGGAGNDTVSYSSSAYPITINLATTGPQDTTGAGLDTILNVENVIGSNYNDTLTGNGGNNVIEGGAGDDILDGAGGNDTVSYASATGNLVFNLFITTSQNTNSAGLDTVSNFENVIGSNYNDNITGDNGDNIIDAGIGNDRVSGELGDDILIGGAGIDMLAYNSSTAGVMVNLTIITPQDTVGAGVDKISGFENITGSSYNDHLIGNNEANLISGGSGDDIIEGGLGNDRLMGDLGSDTISYAHATSAVTVSLAIIIQDTIGAGTDTIINFENILGSTLNDTLTGNSSNNIINGHGGSDTLTGGLGADTFMFDFQGFGMSDTITDFNISQGDKLDISDLLFGYDPLSSAIEDFVSFTTSGSNSIMSVDLDGTGTAFSSHAIASLTAVTGLDADTLHTSGNLIA